MLMGSFTRNLSREEFACKCGCGYDTADFELVNVLQSLVYFYEAQIHKPCAIHINSGSRCESHNKSVGGSDDSQHLVGKAADFYIFARDGSGRIPDDDIADRLEFLFPNSHGIGRYNGRTHFDTRSERARWDKR